MLVTTLFQTLTVFFAVLFAVEWTRRRTDALEYRLQLEIEQLKDQLRLQAPGEAPQLAEAKEVQETPVPLPVTTVIQ
jgi:hypothetical protein